MEICQQIIDIMIDCLKQKVKLKFNEFFSPFFCSTRDERDCLKNFNNSTTDNEIADQMLNVTRKYGPFFDIIPTKLRMSSLYYNIYR